MEVKRPGSVVTGQRPIREQDGLQLISIHLNYTLIQREKERRTVKEQIDEGNFKTRTE